MEWDMVEQEEQMAWGGRDRPMRCDKRNMLVVMPLETSSWVCEFEIVPTYRSKARPGSVSSPQSTSGKRSPQTRIRFFSEKLD